MAIDVLENENILTSRAKLRELFEGPIDKLSITQLNQGDVNQGLNEFYGQNDGLQSDYKFKIISNEIFPGDSKLKELVELCRAILIYVKADAEDSGIQNDIKQYLSIYLLRNKKIDLDQLSDRYLEVSYGDHAGKIIQLALLIAQSTMV